MLLFEVINRGNKLMLNAFDAGLSGSLADRNALTKPGDGHLMREGYTLVWWGWEQDVLEGMSRLLMPEVVAHNADGSSITGMVRCEMVTPTATATLPLVASRQLQPSRSTVSTAIPPPRPTTARRSRTASCRR